MIRSAAHHWNPRLEAWKQPSLNGQKGSPTLEFQVKSMEISSTEWSRSLPSTGIPV